MPVERGTAIMRSEFWLKNNIYHFRSDTQQGFMCVIANVDTSFVWFSSIIIFGKPERKVVRNNKIYLP